MSTKAGALLWNRRRVTIPPLNGGVGEVIDTGLRQPNLSFPDYSRNEPPVGVTMAPPGPMFGVLPASRIQVIPMAPILPATWDFIVHGEPFVDPATGTVKVLFINIAPDPVPINVLFWDPHSIAGPGLADTYNMAVGLFFE